MSYRITAAPRCWLRAAVLALVFYICGSFPGATQTVLNLEQARTLAIHKLESGDPGAAILLAKELLRPDPRDPLVYYILARAHARLNDPDLARRAAALSYRFASTAPARFEAAQFASQMAFQAERYSLSQLWLRRTAIHAPSEHDRDRVARDYRLLRRINPWSLRLRADLRPSNNVNHGSDTALNIIDGIPDGGTIPGAGMALSGLIASLDLVPSFRLHSAARSSTTLGARLYLERVALSSEAKNQAPEARNGDFGSTFAELSLTHIFAAGRDGEAAGELALGESWYGGTRSYRFARVETRRAWRLGNDAHLQLRADLERRFRALYASSDARILGLGADMVARLGNGNVLRLALALRDADSQSNNGSYSSASARAVYTLGRAIGPARLSAGLTLGHTRYESFAASLFIPPTRRRDTSVHGDLSLVFDRYDYAGFVPVLRLRSGRKRSNFSRFSSREFSISLGIGSKF